MTLQKKIFILIITLLISAPEGPVKAHEKSQHMRDQRKLSSSRDGGADFEIPAPGTYQLPPIKEAFDGEVLDADGKKHLLLDLMGQKYILLSFIYTGCADPRGCPLAVFMMNEIRLTLEKNPGLSERVLLITLSFDPLHDTPEVMRDFAKTYGFEEARANKRWLFLTTSSEKKLQPILDGYGQYVVPEIDQSGKLTGGYSHVLKVFLIDLEKRVRNVYSTGFLYKELIINDIKTLTREDGVSRKYVK